jgi:hypothetical protein
LRRRVGHTRGSQHCGSDAQLFNELSSLHVVLR